MVSLAELDATELTDAESESQAADDQSVSPGPGDPAVKASLGPALDLLLAPLDRVGAGLYKLLSGGRAR